MFLKPTIWQRNSVSLMMIMTIWSWMGIRMIIQVSLHILGIQYWCKNVWLMVMLLLWLHVHVGQCLKLVHLEIFNIQFYPVRPKKKKSPHPTKIWKLGRSVGIFFFIFFLRTARELSFPIFFFKFLNGENSGGLQSKRTSHASAFLSHWIQILANQIW